MAGFARDYHPLRILRDAAAAAGHRGLIVHPLWISTLVELGARMLGRTDPIAGMRIDYTQQVYQSDVLTLKLDAGEHHKLQTEFLFEVVNQKRQTVARGKVSCVAG